MSAHSYLSRIMALGASTEAKITSTDNVANHELSSHWQAQATLHITAGSKRKAPPSTLSDSSDELEDVSISSSKWIHKDPITNPAQTSKTPSLANEIEETGSDGILKDIEVVDINEPIKDGKKVQDCDACTKSKKKLVPIVNEATTLQRHQEALHRAEYLKWAKDNNFLSMLPKDAK
ncbi:hypothetical protein SCLCIDRAFT_9341 [Scleroderma citrinum Foug A]|uniref:Uncharacterized protein n=1 Tax=Scleroderma citrinum Foug A TaxID=1036808 RepID=A0A0C3DZV5_9AGAM|nr:hypothetical protein SCLCIDRAFT_9341 [Scleroderma citrinum Foug A]